jgi:hypothetical protein
VNWLSLLLIGIPEDVAASGSISCAWLNLALLIRELLCAAVQRHTSESSSFRCRHLHSAPTLLRGSRSVSIACAFIRAAIYQPPSKVMVSKLPHVMPGGPTNACTSGALKQTLLPPFAPKLFRQAHKRVHSDTQSYTLHILPSMIP